MAREGRHFVPEAVFLRLWGICAVCILVNNMVSWKNGLLLICGVLGILLLYCACVRIPEDRKLSVIILICGIVFLGLQIVLVLSYYFETDWDVQGIVAAAEQFARREKVTAYPFSRFPNNLIMTILYSRVFRIAFTLGLSRDAGYQMILVIQCLIFFAAGQLTFHTARRLTGKNAAAVAAYVVYLALIGLSPWVSILYSDALGLFFPITILWLYTQIPERKKPALFWCLIGFFSFVGYKIKPTAMIALIAIILLELINALRRKNGRALLFVLGGLLAGMAVCSALVYLSGYEVDKERAFGPAHFFAMGLNEESGGAWAEEDHIYSMTFPTVKERTRGDLELAKTRLREMGPRGVCEHLIKKIRSYYNDGTFTWAGEGTFFYLIREETDPILSPWIRSFYYRDGENYALFTTFEQAVWLGVLLLTVFSAFSQPNAGRAVTALSLLGMLAYSILFETRARYLFIYGPYYILLSVLGVCALEEWIHGKKTGRMHNTDS